ncbi:uncharacterized protein LOC104879122 [Vitis vinifera]|uniref:uncharacterized protein LOC104879122 n=1 Tax=Vitis vinifera TaxID=29760 RepID=UPI00053F94A4|nr:uncharacterized protein LOC104879122 [Vitis vinifera]|eukprot:XP_010649015.1 PREDICTED: uncharacterized protein LOC104879122 [Vitis vinifera]
MTHIWLLLWPKLTSTTATKCDGDGEGAAATAAASKAPTTTTTTTTSCTSTTTSTHCHGLRKLVRKLKKQSRMLRAAATRPSSGSTFQCKYDPQSYSLNFDSSGWGSFLDGDYYQFHAFSSRFVANPTTLPPRLVAPSH